LENTPNSPFYTPQLKDNAPIAFALQLANSLTGSIEATQLLFNGNYLVGLKASRTYQELSAKQLKQAKVTLAEQILKAYYLVLVNQEKSRLLDLNVSRLDSTLREVQALYKNGFAEKVDLDRLEVSLNNLKAERQKTNRLLSLGKNALKFQMGMPLSDSLELSGKLSDVNPDSLSPAQSNFDYNNRIEYSLLNTQKALANLQLKNVQAGYMPTLVGLATLGVNSAASRFSNLGNITEKNRYAPYGFVGLNLSVPIFDGFQKKYQAQQARINIQKVDNMKKMAESSIDLEVTQANTNLANAFTNFEIQKRNLKLAEEVIRVTKVKYRQGLGSNLEVTNAESDLKESQVNYYSAMYDFIIAKIDLDKAQGKLVND
jgi:outer membrane protein TolC